MVAQTIFCGRFLWDGQIHWLLSVCAEGQAVWSMNQLEKWNAHHRDQDHFKLNDLTLDGFLSEVGNENLFDDLSDPFRQLSWTLAC